MSKPCGLCTASTSWTCVSQPFCLYWTCSRGLRRSFSAITARCQIWAEQSELRQEVFAAISILSLLRPSNMQEAALKYPGRAPVLQGTDWEGEDLEEWIRNWVSVGKEQIETQKIWARRKKENKWWASRLLGRETRIKSRRQNSAEAQLPARRDIWEWGWRSKRHRNCLSYNTPPSPTKTSCNLISL